MIRYFSGKNFTLILDENKCCSPIESGFINNPCNNCARCDIFEKGNKVIEIESPSYLKIIRKREYEKVNKESKAEKFISRSIKIHGDRYDYSLVRYEHSHKKVKIICKKHGVFKQSPASHLQGSNCYMCSGTRSKDGAIKRHIKMLSEIGVEARGANSELEVKCYKCGKWHVQKLNNSWMKINTAKGKYKGEYNLYCSDGCKNSCIVFNHKSKSIDPRSMLYIEKSEQEFARSCQTDTLKQLQCESHGYNYCEKCGDIVDVELHHTYEVSKHGANAINSAGHMLLCAGCHVELHGECKIT